MIETSNPEIDVNELMERVRLEAARISSERPQTGRRPSTGRRQLSGAAAMALPPLRHVAMPPAIGISGPVTFKKERFDKVLEKARQMIQVAAGVPRIFHGLFRRQGGFNRAVLEVVNSLAKANAQLGQRVNELMIVAGQQDNYIRTLAESNFASGSWMKAAERIIATFEPKVATLHAELAEISARLGTADARLGQLDAESNERDRVFERKLGEQSEVFQRLRSDMERAGEHLRNLQREVDRQTEIAAVLEQRTDAQAIAQARAETHLGHFEHLHQALARLEERQANDAIFLKSELAQQGMLLHRSPARGKGKTSGTVERDAESAETHRLDSFYFSFENRFRGQRSAIKKRVAFYLPILREADAGSDQRPILDLGCGRGEWLELLQENGLAGSGVDLNRAMVAQCEQRNLLVTHADAVTHLRALDDESCGAVTGFHIIEHLPLETLVDLVAETRRVLQPGGVAIFESPNCKNLTVGACNFNIDPTHRNPVFPETAEFILETQGFEAIRLEYLSPAEQSPFAKDDPNSAALTQLFYGPQDFAVIGRKPKTT